ncbi:ATP-binding cassette domain-containing protein [Nonomuraea rhodomycinica]|uniref:ATP-binding cassette domain-containing protein n=1 Tax=Nonomuraea rhodomycinica TaxID=1712872 RepID=UPI0028AC8F1B|nr:ATP-binding cassette domain-containing protein [Nonomuraea rhodomycinica]
MSGRIRPLARLSIGRRYRIRPACCSAPGTTCRWTSVGPLVSSGGRGEVDTVGLVRLGLLPSEATHKPVVDLSIGQWRRLDLTVLLAGRPHVVLLDEPTNDLSMTLWGSRHRRCPPRVPRWCRPLTTGSCCAPAAALHL